MGPRPAIVGRRRRHAGVTKSAAVTGPAVTARRRERKGGVCGFGSVRLRAEILCGFRIEGWFF